MPAVEDRTGALLELLIQINRELAAALDLRTVLQRLIFAAMQHVGGERASIVVLDDAGKPLDATIVYGSSLHEHTIRQLTDTVDRGLAGWVVRHRKAALLVDTSQDERWLRRPDDAKDRSGAKAALCVPLIARERLVGVLTVVHSMPGAFGAAQLELAEAIADQASIAVLNARLYTESARQARIMTALADGAAAFNTSLNLHEVWQRVLNQTIQAMQVETAAIGLIEGPDRDIVFRAATGLNAGSIIDRRIPGAQSLMGQVLGEGRGMVIASTADEQRFTDTLKFSGIQAKAVAIAPIQAHGRMLGILEAINPVSQSFDADAVTVMTGLGSLAGASISNAELYEQLENAHRRYRELFEDSIDPIFITDWSGAVTEANREALRLSGFPPGKLTGMSIQQVHDINWNKVGADFERLREEEVISYESALRKADRDKIPVMVYARRVQFEEADSIQWTMHDITERKELDELREDLTSMIYHDLRSPLGNIVSSLGLLQSMVGADEATQSVLKVASHSTGRIQRLLDSLLDINRLESGQSIVEQSETRVEELIRAAIADVGPASLGRRQTVETVIEPELPAIWVDPDMIRRVLTNLLENAIKYSRTGTRIVIGAKKDAASRAVQFWVQDDGPGVPLADQKRIFEKFARVKAGGYRPTGLGIGLAFCRTAVQAHGGIIWIESEEGKGSRFVFTLPMKAPTV
ncbi:MAG TPA: GAF domain-containing protein [Anaerolineales bacterium]|nr:GAF domain-containing protein [Anaerolineales bacterium]